MKLVKLSGSIFCGAAWSNRDIEVLAIDRDSALQSFLNECTAIDLRKSLDYGKRLEPIDYDLVKAVPQSMCVNKDFELFKLNPEKYIDLYWEEIELPYVIVN